MDECDPTKRKRFSEEAAAAAESRSLQAATTN